MRWGAQYDRTPARGPQHEELTARIRRMHREWRPAGGGTLCARVGQVQSSHSDSAKTDPRSGVSKRPKEPVYYPSGELNCVKQISFAKYSPPEEGDTGAPKRVGHKSSVDCCMYIGTPSQPTAETSDETPKKCTPGQI
ncbi:uncharacterized protein LOC143997731 isoform X3 [Lithobates pipiens]